MIEYDLWIPELPRSQADVMQRFERAKSRKRWHRLVHAALLEAGWRPGMPLLPEVAIQFTRCSSGKKPDYQGLVYSFKSPTDGLVGRVIKDDSDEFIPIQTYHYEHVKRADQGIRMRIMQIL